MELGWTEKQFWNSNPAVYDHALKQLSRKIQREDYRAGLIAAVIQNLMRSKESEAVMPMDFFPKHQDEKERFDSRSERRRMDAQVVNALLFRARQKALDKKAKKKGLPE